MGSFAASANTSFLLGSNTPVPSGTANGVLYLDGSKVVTSGSVFRFDGTNVLLADGTQIRSPDNFSIFDTSSSLQRFNWSTSNTYAARTGGAHIFNIAAGEQMRLNSTGLGIGTNNPGYKLHVNTSTVNDIARFEGSAVNGGFASFSDGTAVRLFAGFGPTLCSTAASTDGVIRYSGNLLFSRNAIETARMDSSGNLGIGASSPGAKLHINTGGNATTGGILLANAGNQQHFWYLSSNTTSTFEIGSSLGQWTWTNSNGERMRLDASGNLGLGVTPGAWGGNRRALQIGSSGSFSEFIGSGNGVALGQNYVWNGSAYVYINSAAAARFGYGYDVAGAFTWLTAPSGTAGNAISFTQAMTLDANGNLVIGASAAIGSGLRLDVVSSTTGDNRNRIRNTTGGEAFLLFQNSDTGTTTTSGLLIGILSNEDSYFYNYHNSPIIFGTNNVERLRLDANGNVIVNTAAIATNATNGFLYVPTCAGTPTGTPTTYAGRSPIVVDTTNNKLYFYSGGQWRDAGP